MGPEKLMIRMNKKHERIFQEMQRALEPQGETLAGAAGIFILCAYLGWQDYQAGNKLPESFAAKDICRFSELSIQQQTILKAMAIKAKGYPILAKAEEMIAFVEKIADRGMDLMYEKLLKDYTRELRPGELVLELPSDCRLEEIVTKMIQEEIMRNSPL